MTGAPKLLADTLDRPIDDPLPEGLPIIDEPGRQVPVVDPRPPQSPRPARDPQPAPGTPRPADA
jgi:hypothetical protein